MLRMSAVYIVRCVARCLCGMGVVVGGGRSLTSQTVERQDARWGQSRSREHAI